MSLPRIILVREERESDGSMLLIAGRRLDDVVTDDAETIGTYKLVGKRRVRKVPTVLKEIKVP